LPQFFVGQGLDHLGLFRWKMRQPPHRTIDKTHNEADGENKFKGIRDHIHSPLAWGLYCLERLAKWLPLRGGNKQAKASPKTMTSKSTTPDFEAVLTAIGNRPIVLIGLMGAGKTSIGRRLAEKLDLPFIDADVEIEKAAGKSIPDIFSEHGEAHFRDGERRVIARLLENGRQVLATGGGAFMNAETRQAIKAHSVSVWLKADLEVLLKRVSKRGGRPLLENRDPAEVLRTLMAVRYPVYAEADITVESVDAQHSHMVNAVIDALAHWQNQNELSRHE
jgi:shikimate kinase